MYTPEKARQYPFYFYPKSHVLQMISIIVGYKANHSDHDTAFTKLLQTARENNVKLNFQKLQYKQTQVDFFGET